MRDIFVKGLGISLEKLIAASFLIARNRHYGHELFYNLFNCIHIFSFLKFFEGAETFFQKSFCVVLKPCNYLLESLAADLEVCKGIEACAGGGEKNAVAAYGRL